MMNDIAYEPDFNAWGKLGYTLESSFVKDGIYHWELKHYSSTDFRGGPLVIDFCLTKGPESIRIFRIQPLTFDPNLDPHEVIKKENELAQIERRRIKEFLISIEEE